MQADAILFQNDDFLVIDKPVGISVQNEAESSGCIEELKGLVGLEKLHPVHRLDKVTSGLLLVAKNESANRELSNCFQRREIEKYYFAISAKKPSRKQGAVIGDMTPARNGCWKLLREKLNPAITQFFSYGLGGGLRLFIVKPVTGKTHQIRVALKSLGSPIVGDTAYGGITSDRVYLHAGVLGFVFKGKRYSFFLPPNHGDLYSLDAVKGHISEDNHPRELRWPA